MKKILIICLIITLVISTVMSHEDDDHGEAPRREYIFSIVLYFYSVSRLILCPIGLFIIFFLSYFQ